MNFHQLYTISYWFNIRPDELSSPFLIFFCVFFTLLVLSKFIFFFYYKKNKDVILKPYKKFIQKGETALFSLGICGLFWLFFAYEQVPFLSARFWMIIWLFSALLWVYFIIRYKNFELEPLLKQMAERERIEKWMPKKS